MNIFLKAAVTSAVIFSTSQALANDRLTEACLYALSKQTLLPFENFQALEVQSFPESDPPNVRLRAVYVGSKPKQSQTLKDVKRKISAGFNQNEADKISEVLQSFDPTASEFEQSEFEQVAPLATQLLEGITTNRKALETGGFDLGTAKCQFKNPYSPIRLTEMRCTDGDCLELAFGNQRRINELNILLERAGY